MANIKNYISLTDRMSPVFRSIIKSMDSTLRTMKLLDQQSNKGATSRAFRQAQKDVQRANNALIKMENQMKMVNKEASKTESIFSRIGKGSGISPFNLTNLASGVYLLKNAARTLSSMMEAPDTAKATQYRLDTYDTSSATGNQLYDAAYQAAMRSRSDVDSTASLASRILVSGAVGSSGAEAIRMSEILNKASFLGGSSKRESQMALMQLSQGLASGVLQGDELRSVREQAPGLTSTLAKGLSKLAEQGKLPESFIGTTAGDLKELGGDGELTAQRILDAFRVMEDEVNQTFEQSPKLFGQAMTGIVNVWKRWAKLMAESDNAFAKINDKAWQLLEWFQSSDGEAFMMNLAKGINFVVDAIFGLIDGIIWLVNQFLSLENSSQILTSILIGLGAAFMVAGIQAMVAWILAAWPVLLVIAAVALLISILYECGLITQQILGGICGGFLFLGYLIYDIVIWILAIVAYVLFAIWDFVIWLVFGIVETVTLLVTIIILAIQGILQLVLWLITTIWAGITALAQVWNTVWNGFQIVVKNVALGIVGYFNEMAQKVLGIIYKIAEAIDWVFGSNLADAVAGWSSGLDSKVGQLESSLNASIQGDAKDIGDGWKNWASNIGDMYAGNGKYDDWNITDNMADVWSGGTGLVNSIDQFGQGLMLNPNDVVGWGVDMTANPMDGWNAGYDFGSNLAGDLSNLDLDLGIEDLTGFYDSAPQDVTVDGGDLDSVGKIKSDVDISDEDLKLLRDIAARDFLLNLKTVTPQANVKFGDVRETADINKIMETIENMVEEQLATSLVME